VLVQSQPNDADSDWLIALAGASEGVGAVVAWADLRAPDAGRRLAALAASPKVRGVRPMLQDLPPDWILHPSCRAALSAMADFGLVLDALIRPRHLSAIATLAASLPALTIVVDHAAKPDLAGGDPAMLAMWKATIAALARHPNVVCKLSGLVTEAGPDWTAERLRPAVGHLLACFGAERLIWGSDWPVVLLAADYAEWLATAESLLARLPAAARAAVFGGNAARVYRIAA
jgi:L-fuconolactonase